MARQTYEHGEYAAMMRRMLKAWGRRVEDGDPEDLTELLEARALLDDAIGHAIAGQRSRWDRSWADIARAAGITRQAAQQKWGKYGKARGSSQA